MGSHSSSSQKSPASVDKCDFKRYDERDRFRMIRNMNHEILRVYAVGNTYPTADFAQRPVPRSKADKDGVEFNMRWYKIKNNIQWPNGIPVVFQIKVNGSDYHLCCPKEGTGLVFKEGEAPAKVKQNMNIIFFQQSLDGQYHKFESAWAQGWFLCTKDHTLAMKIADGTDEMIAIGLDTL
ncbi:interleukin-18-like [Amblyraja radiata]|uniref:interleukin-18-like n=1 Tax=Amblyraja radiata TaxID=386614 RepID=UPI001402C209|nr:interleukin-18-like [Amblyraja radiata]